MAHDLDKKFRTKDVLIEEQLDFSALLLKDCVLAGLAKTGFKKPSPIQLNAIPMGRFGKDLWIQAKSGTGKTLVFVIVALEMLLDTLFVPQVLILVPTCEIATQIHSVIQNVGSSFRHLKCGIFIGGLPVEHDTLRACNCQIVVGTPGRIQHLLDIKALNKNSIRLLVLDEADQLLGKAWETDIASIFNTLPEEKQVIAVSATYPQKLKKVITKYLREPYIAHLDSEKPALLGVVHYIKIVEPTSMSLKHYDLRAEALKPILKTLDFTQCLVYCNGIFKVQTLYRQIKNWGFSATFISSNRTQTDRLKVIELFKRFKFKVLVSSDVTSRGIDVENVDLVVNFDLATSLETYIHRSGRAGRYGTTGLAISIIDSSEFKTLEMFEKEANFKSYILPDPLPMDLIRNPSYDKYDFETENEPNPISDALERIQNDSEFLVNDNLEISTLFDDTTKSSKSLESLDSVCQSKDSVKGNQDLNFEESSPKVSTINSSVLNECKESYVSIPSSIENLCTVIKSTEVSDVESKISAVQSDNAQDIGSTFPDASLKSTVTDKSDLDVHNCELSKHVQTFVKTCEANRSGKSTNVLSNKESLVTENFETDNVLEKKIIDLNSKKSDYYYRVFKLFLEENECSNSENKIQENLEETQNNEDEFCTERKAFLGEANDEEIKAKEDHQLVRASENLKELSDNAALEKYSFKSECKGSIDTRHYSSEDSGSESCSDSSSLSSTSSSLEFSSSKGNYGRLRDRGTFDKRELSFSSSFKRKLVSSNKKVPVHHHTHSSCCHLNVCQQPHFLRCSSTHQNTYNSEHFPVCHHPHKSSSSEYQKCRSRKKYNSVHKKNQPSHSSGIKEQHSPLCFKSSEHKCHPYNSSNDYNQREIYAQCWQPHFSRCSSINQNTYNSEHFPVHRYLHKSSSSEYKMRRSKKNYDSVHKKNQPSFSSGFKEQHSNLCFKPSEHRCHPYNASIDCNHRGICDIFYNQWLHIYRQSLNFPFL